LLGHFNAQPVNFERRTILISGDIDNDTFQKVDAAVTEMESNSGKAITIKLNSTGGTVYDALAIVGRLKASKCNIHTEGYGAVMSAAVAILACGKRRKMSKYGWGMVHQSHYEISGKVNDHKAFLEQSHREEQQWAELMASQTTETKDFWIEQCNSDDKYLTAEQLLEHGVVDEIN
jgi:ATP-dependent protease ClpP protease subunit